MNAIFFIARLSCHVRPAGDGADMSGQIVDSMQEIPLPDGLTSPVRRFKSPFQGHRIREGGGDAEKDGKGREREQVSRVAANDNTGTGGGPEARIDDAVMRIARLLGRQIAREQFRQSEATNDNAPEGEARQP